MIPTKTKPNKACSPTISIENGRTNAKIPVTARTIKLNAVRSETKLRRYFFMCNCAGSTRAMLSLEQFGHVHGVLTEFLLAVRPVDWSLLWRPSSL